MADPVADIVASGRASDVDAAAALVRALARAVDAERAFLVRVDGTTARVVAAHPADAAPGGAIPLATSVHADAPTIVDGGAVLVAPLRVDGAARRWSVRLDRRAGRPWGADDAARLARLAPLVELALDHALAHAAPPGAGAAASSMPSPEIIAALSHELRNPLAPILMWTATLRRMRPGDAEIERATRAIDHAVALERRLIESLVSIGRIQRGLVELRSELVDLNAVVRQQIASHREDLVAARVEIDETLPAAPVVVRGDGARLNELVGHLVENAIKFSGAGGRIAVDVTPGDDVVELRVRDTGGGVPPEMVSRLFLPFQKGPNARGGLGVGLAIVRGLATLHGGSVEAERPADGGATFVVRLPLARAA